MALYNRKGIFSNEQDTLEVLDQVLNSLFEQVRIQVVGCVALFQAKNPIRHH
ncbi:MAG: adhesin [Pseudomonadota bacterium]|nr:adhesin [Pseudomonadota bacterium]